jgi:hypothetical protein
MPRLAPVTRALPCTSMWSRSLMGSILSQALPEYLAAGVTGSE